MVSYVTVGLFFFFCQLERCFLLFVEKSKQGIEATEEAAEVPLLPPAKKAKHDSQLLLEQAAASTNPRNGKVSCSSL